MPKRIPTPPPGDDEPKYLVCHHPYPLLANHELQQDNMLLTAWLACVFGKDNVFAFFHKPSSPQMVIVEINRDFGGFDRVLGAHKWSEFLREPKPEERDKVSKFFYCTLNTGRKVQKLGWREIRIEDTWLQRWSPNNRYIQYPYPAALYCDTPVEDKTNRPLCCPLPTRIYAPPPTKPAPPVGSAAWLADRNNGSKSASERARIRTATGTMPSTPRVPSHSPIRAGSAWSALPVGPTVDAASASDDTSSSSPASWSGGLAGRSQSHTKRVTSVNEFDAREPTIATSDSHDSLADGEWPSMTSAISEGIATLQVSDEDGTQTTEPSDTGHDSEHNADEGYATFWAQKEAEMFEHNNRTLELSQCPTHGSMCSKGICRDFQAAKRKLEGEKRAREAAEARATAKRKKGKGAKNAPVKEEEPELAFQPDRSGPQRATQKEWMKIRTGEVDSPTAAASDGSPLTGSNRTPVGTVSRSNAWGAKLVVTAPQPISITSSTTSSGTTSSSGSEPYSAIPALSPGASSSPATSPATTPRDAGWILPKGKPKSKKGGKANGGAWDAQSAASSRDPWAAKSSNGDGWDIRSTASSVAKSAARSDASSRDPWAAKSSSGDGWDIQSSASSVAKSAAPSDASSRDPWAMKSAHGDGWETQSNASSTAPTVKSAASSKGWGPVQNGHW